MPLTGDMRRLCDRLAYDNDRRWDAVHAIRENAARSMSDIREAHRKRTDEMSRRMHDLNAARDRMTAEQRHRLTEFHNNLHHNVSEFVGDLEEAHKNRAFQISEHIHDLGNARMKMGAGQERMLMEFHNDLHDSVSEFVGNLTEAHEARAEDMNRHIHDLGTARMKMSAEQEQMLMEFHTELHDSVNDFVKGLQEAHKNRAEEVSQEVDDFGAAREKMSAEQEQMLMEFHTQLHDSVDDYVNGLREAHKNRAKDMSREIHDFGAARKKMSVDQSRKLTQEHMRLEATMGQTRKELRNDIKRAHQMWVDFAAKVPHRGAKGGAVHMKPAPAATRGGGAAVAADDLTIIPGIGPNRQQRLHQLGIHTFAQLAHTTEAKLRDALGQSARLVDVGKWIEEAKKLV